MMALSLLKGSPNFCSGISVLLYLILELKQSLNKDVQTVCFKVSILDLVMPLSSVSREGEHQ